MLICKVMTEGMKLKKFDCNKTFFGWFYFQIKTELQARAEKEIRDLGVVKEKLEAEWEQVKFMGQEENTELREKMEDLEETITQEQERKKEAEEKLEAQNKLLIGIREGLDQLVDKLFLGDSQVILGM